MHNETTALFLITVYVNAHSTRWHLQVTYMRGEYVDEFIDRHDLCVVNTRIRLYIFNTASHYTNVDITPLVV